MTATEASIQDEYRAFEGWALRRKKPTYARKSAKTILRLLRALRTIDPTEDQVATWFDIFRSARCTRQGKSDLDENGDPIPPKNGTITTVAAYIKLYSRFRLESGRTNGIAKFLDDVLGQYSEDDSVSHPPVTPEEFVRIVRAASQDGDKEFVVYLHALYDLGARADTILGIKWLDLTPAARRVHIAVEKQSYNREGYVSQETMDELLAIRRTRENKTGFIFVNRDQSDNPNYTTGERMSYFTVRRLFVKYASIAGVVGKSLHGVRSARITDLFQAGAPAQTVAMITRTSLRTLTRYNKPGEEQRLADFDKYTTRRA